MSESLDEMTDEERARLFPIILSEHKPVWGKRFLREKTELEQAIGPGNVVRISHIGSTAVPELIAKPTIDILFEIRDGADTASLVSNMQRQGYRYIEKPTTPNSQPPHMMFIKGYTEEGFKGQAFHVHIRYGGDWDEICFRDYLLAHPETAEEYGRLKLGLKQEFEYDRDAYTNAKTEFIKQICRLARAEVKAERQPQEQGQSFIQRPGLLASSGMNK